MKWINKEAVMNMINDYKHYQTISPREMMVLDSLQDSIGMLPEYEFEFADIRGKEE